MKLLTFQARRFRWRTFERTLEEVEHLDVDEEVAEAVVAFLHAEEADRDPDARPGVVRKTLKHLKWVANKRELRTVVLHSFTHLGGERTDPLFAQELLEELAQRLRDTGYDVRSTPFGHMCEWELSVYGESMAKVWKEV